MGFPPESVHFQSADPLLVIACTSRRHASLARLRILLPAMPTPGPFDFLDQISWGDTVDRVKQMFRDKPAADADGDALDNARAAVAGERSRFSCWDTLLNSPAVVSFYFGHASERLELISIVWPERQQPNGVHEPAGGSASIYQRIERMLGSAPEEDRGIMRMKRWRLNGTNIHLMFIQWPEGNVALLIMAPAD